MSFTASDLSGNWGQLIFFGDHVDCKVTERLQGEPAEGTRYFQEDPVQQGCVAQKVHQMVYLHWYAMQGTCPSVATGRHQKQSHHFTYKA